MEIKPLGTKHGWSSVFRATSTNKNCCDYGDRIPGMYFQSGSTRLYIGNAVNGNGNFHRTEKIALFKEIPLNKFTLVTIEQVIEDGEYRYSIYFDHEELYSTINSKPRVFKHVNVYMGDSFYNPANAVIRNFNFENLEI